MKPLIFDSLEVAWEQVLPAAALSSGRDRPRVTPLRTFPGPGDGAQKSLDAVKQSGSGLRFPAWGQWRVIGSFGAIKLLLIDPTMQRDDVAGDILGFVGSNVWHRPTDHHLAHVNGNRRVFHFERLAEKFFHSDQPLGLHCGYAARFLGIILDRSNFRVRIGKLKERGRGHIFPEVFLPVAKCWAIVDPDFGVMLRRQGVWLCGDALIELMASGRGGDVEIVDVCGKCFPKMQYQFSPNFYGQITWSREFVDVENACARQYVNNVISHGFSSIRYTDFRIIEDTTIYSVVGQGSE